MKEPRNTWVYQLKHAQEIVYYGISNDPDRRSTQHGSSRKRFTHVRAVSRALTRASALKREEHEIQRYQRQHGGRPPKYNVYKVYR